MTEKFKRIERKLVHKGHIVEFYDDYLITPEGRTVVFDYIRHKGAAAILPVRDDGKLLMVHQYRNALDRETIEIPAGGLETPDEPTVKAASRELEEETGYKSDNLELLISIRTCVAYCDEKIDIYVAKNLIPSKQNLDEDEFIDVEAYTVEELMQLIYSGVIEDSKTISAVLAYKEKYC